MIAEYAEDVIREFAPIAPVADPVGGPFCGVASTFHDRDSTFRGVHDIILG